MRKGFSVIVTIGIVGFGLTFTKAGAMRVALGIVCVTICLYNFDYRYVAIGTALVEALRGLRIDPEAYLERHFQRLKQAGYSFKKYQ